MIHIDLFSGIGGFALAADRVFGNITHIFVDNDPFCQEVIKKHWPNAPIFGDIRTLTYAEYNGRDGAENSESSVEGADNNPKGTDEIRQPKRSDTVRPVFDILTGGFPCQPFSQAGRRKGTEDDRYLWPEMARVIREFKPEWVVAENVAGLITWNEGVVFETVCTDLETEGYEVQAFVIPACAVGAPHRRDRVWIVANRISAGTRSAHGEINRNSKRGRQEQDINQRSKIRSNFANGGQPDWSRNWHEVALATCNVRVDDGLPRRMDRNSRLKALGNAIVPQVAEEIFKAIKATQPKTAL